MTALGRPASRARAARVAATGPASGPRLGIAGGGQLARMTAQAAAQLGVDVVILDRDGAGPATTVTSGALSGDWSSLEDLRRLAERVDVLTFENEFIDAGVVAALEADGVVVRPAARVMALVQDKFVQKTVLTEAGVPVAAFRALAAEAEVHALAAAWGWPLVLKRRRDGYDGRGNVTLRGPGDVAPGHARLAGAPVYAEAFCPFVKELATIVTRGPDGTTVVYPVVETVQREHICHSVTAPADVPAAVAGRAAALAERAVRAVDGTGSFGVEMFLLADGSLVVNELAPRVHNSGHYTIEACHCSQFENHVRAVLGWPLGSPLLRAPAAAMVNLLGTGRGPGRPAGLERALAVPGAAVHLYGKAASDAGRKMGHVTALGPTAAAALAVAQAAADLIVFGGDDGARA